MKKITISKSLFKFSVFFRQNWVAIAAVLIGIFVAARGTPLWAATVREINQTVPIPTPTKLPTPVPPATATPKPASDNSGGGQPSQPVNTPTEKPATTTQLIGSVKSKTLNLRSGPGTGYAVIGVFSQGDKVQILERNEKGDWWHVCCLPNTETHGWVSMNFITPDFDAAQALKLIPVASAIPPLPTPTSTPSAASTTKSSGSKTKTAIELFFVQSPVYPLPGSIITMHITVTNPTTTDALDVELRDELPQGMSVIEIKADENTLVQQDVTENLREVYSVLWPTLAAGETVTATATLLIDPEIANGTVLDNLLYAGGANVPGSTAGISIGMPPVSLPDFQ